MLAVRSILHGITPLLAGWNGRFVCYLMVYFIFIFIVYFPDGGFAWFLIPVERPSTSLYLHTTVLSITFYKLYREGEAQGRDPAARAPREAVSHGRSSSQGILMGGGAGEEAQAAV